MAARCPTSPWGVGRPRETAAGSTKTSARKLACDCAPRLATEAIGAILNGTMPRTLQVLFLGAGIACAQSIDIPNNSFEQGLRPLDTGFGPYSNVLAGSTVPTGGALVNWTAYGTSNAAVGAYTPSGAYTAISPQKWWDGDNFGYIYVFGSGWAGMSQILSTKLQNNTTYTLAALVGRVPRYFCNYEIQLSAGTTVLVTSRKLQNAPTFVSATDTLVYFSGVHNSHAGERLDINFTAAGTEQGYSGVFFDRITLTSVPGAIPSVTPGLPGRPAQPNGGSQQTTAVQTAVDPDIVRRRQEALAALVQKVSPDFISDLRMACALGTAPLSVDHEHRDGKLDFPDAADACLTVLRRHAAERIAPEFYDWLARLGHRSKTPAELSAEIGKAALAGVPEVDVGMGRTFEVTPSLSFDVGFTKATLAKAKPADIEISPSDDNLANLLATVASCLDDRNLSSDKTERAKANRTCFRAGFGLAAFDNISK